MQIYWNLIGTDNFGSPASTNVLSKILPSTSFFVIFSYAIAEYK